MDIWKDVIGYEGLYQVSIFGVIRSYPRFCKVRGGGLQLRPRKNLSRMLDRYSNFYRVTLRKNGKNNKLYVHRLVAECFVPNPDNHKMVIHRNGLKTDNRSSNLKWGTK